MKKEASLVFGLGLLLGCAAPEAKPPRPTAAAQHAAVRSEAMYEAMIRAVLHDAPSEFRITAQVVCVSLSDGKPLPDSVVASLSTCVPRVLAATACGDGAAPCCEPASGKPSEAWFLRLGNLEDRGNGTAEFTATLSRRASMDTMRGAFTVVPDGRGWAVRSIGAWFE